MNDTTKQKLSLNIKQLKELLLMFLPKGKNEVILFLGLILFYSSYVFYIVLNTSVIDNVAFKTDTFFSFDAPEIYEQGYQSMIPHPLMRYFTAPIIFIGNILSVIFATYKAKTILWTIVCLILVSMSSVYIFRYLREIEELKKSVSYLITLMFATTSTCLVLCFTPESYTISVFLISFTLYYYSRSIKDDKPVSFLSNFTLATLLGGTTITNYAMGVIPMFYTKGNIKQAIRKSIYIGLSVFVIFAWLQIQYNFLFDVKKRLDYFTTPRGSYYEHAIDWFFGAPMFFPKVISHFNTVFNRNVYVVHMEFYNHWWQYLFVGIIAGLLVYSIVRNIKNKHVQIVSLFMGVSVFIHLIVKYGIDEPMIFGGHWIYAVPILLGWLYTSLKSERSKTALICIFVVLFIAQTTNNLIQINNFIEVSLAIFPPV